MPNPFKTNTVFIKINQKNLYSCSKDFFLYDNYHMNDLRNFGTLSIEI